MTEKIKQRVEAVDKQLEQITEQIAKLQNQLSQATSIRLQLLGAKTVLRDLQKTEE